VGDVELFSMIPHSSAEAFGLNPGDKVSILLKSTELLLDK
jgi:hypothetical protein